MKSVIKSCYSKRNQAFKSQEGANELSKLQQCERQMCVLLIKPYFVCQFNDTSIRNHHKFKMARLHMRACISGLGRD